jgi:hypothetical protein
MYPEGIAARSKTRNYALNTAEPHDKRKTAEPSHLEFRGKFGCAGAQRGLNTAILLAFERRIVA